MKEAVESMGGDYEDICVAMAKPRAARARVYAGFVARKYKWPASREGLELTKHPEGGLVWRRFGYDAKRSFGRGPKWVVYSDKGGVLASG